jgi:hypothetical protein
MKNKLLILVLGVSLLSSCGGMKQKSTSVDPEKGFSPLFNGKDIKDWFVKIYHHEVGENFGNTFRVVDGIIQIRYDQYGDFNDQFGHLYYKTPFSKYHLKFEYRFLGKQHRGAPDYTLSRSQNYA